MYVSPLRQKAFPFGEGAGIADGRGLCLPLWGRRHYRRKRLLPSPLGKVSALPTEEVIAFPFGKVSALPTEEVIAFPFGEGVGFADGRGYCLPFWGRCRLSRRKRTMRQKVSPLGGVCLSFGLNWEECRRRETLLSFKIQNGKEGLP